jgi:UDP-N-acetylglucosamine--N-acetylmuramyl-(pentapeptide) pyrophosphoryl-undecaprenol N-acetylglucosamine transferase
MGKRLLIAGGGTGGHVYPGMAVAEEWLSFEPGNEVRFVGSAGGIEARVLPAAGYVLDAIRVRPLAGKGLSDRLRGLLVLPLSLGQAWRVIRRFRPDVVLGTGGYASGPPLLAARFSRLPTAIQEQNSVPGATNVILSRLVDRVFINLEMTRASFPKADREAKIILAGNPVRRVIREKLVAARRQPIQNHRLCLLVIGGSRGARRLNNLVLEAMAHLRQFKDSIKIIHQTGSGDLMQTISTYAKLDFRAKVQEFITDMATALAEADIVISRAGAGALAEIALAGKPSILVPFPFAAQDHQAKNAEAMVRAGAARMFREDKLTGRVLAEALKPLLEDPALRQEWGAKAEALARPDAARVVVQGLHELLDERGKSGTSLKPAPRREPEP